MAVPTRTPLGASTTNRKWALDVQDPDVPGVWVPVMGIQESKPRPAEATTQDDSDMDGEGFKSQTTTAMTWGYDGKVLRKTRDGAPTQYDPGQEIIRKAANRLDSKQVIPFRYYELDPGGPRVEAYEGKGVPTWAPDGGNMESLDSVPFTLTGRGKRQTIVHPEANGAAPAVARALPSGAPAASTVVIQGQGFTGVTGATGVKFGATNATSYVVDADDLIRAIVPAGAAGPANITVTHPTTGASNILAYTRGA